MSDNLRQLSDNELLEKLADAKWSAEYDAKQIAETRQMEKNQGLLKTILSGSAVDSKTKQDELDSLNASRREVSRLANEAQRRGLG